MFSPGRKLSSVAALHRPRSFATCAATKFVEIGISGGDGGGDGDEEGGGEGGGGGDGDADGGGDGLHGGGGGGGFEGGLGGVAGKQLGSMYVPTLATSGPRVVAVSFCGSSDGACASNLSPMSYLTLLHRFANVMPCSTLSSWRPPGLEYTAATSQIGIGPQCVPCAPTSAQDDNSGTQSMLCCNDCCCNDSGLQLTQDGAALGDWNVQGALVRM